MKIKSILIALCFSCLSIQAFADEVKEKSTAAEVKKEQPKAVLQPTEPQSPTEAVSAVKGAVAAAQQGQWWYCSAAAVFVLMFILKMAGLLAKMGRWKHVIVPVLSVAAMLLARFQGGVSWEAAIAVLTSAASTAALEEAWSHGILQKGRAASASTSKTS